MENSIYTVDYFLTKFKNIADSFWCCFDIGHEGAPRCANGHVRTREDEDGYEKEGAESVALTKLFKVLKVTPIKNPLGFSPFQDWHRYMNFAGSDCESYSRIAEQINNGNTNEYQQSTPKARILAALQDIKKLQQPEPKERIGATMKFPKLVLEEAKKLRKLATNTEKDKLNFARLNPESKFSCIYGQMTGDCFSIRATDLIKSACVRVYSKSQPESESNVFVHSNIKLNGKPKEEGFARCGKWYSPIEVFISKAYAKEDTKSLERLVKFIKGEIKSL